MLVKYVKLLFVFCLLFSFTTVNAANYDDDVLEIFAKLLPRFIIMSDQKLKIKDQIDVCILREDVEEDAATTLIDKIIDNYPSGIKKDNIELIQTDFTDLNVCKNSELLFLFNASPKKIREALLYAKNHQTLTVSYDASLLAEGVEVSLFLGRKILPYINVKALKRNSITIDQILLRISKIYMETDK